MTRTDRLTAILDLLAESGHVEVEDIVTRLGVSPATARRDLDSLAKQRLLSRTRGGALSAGGCSAASALARCRIGGGLRSSGVSSRGRMRALPGRRISNLACRCRDSCSNPMI